VNAPALLIAFRSSNSGAIRTIKKEKKDYAQGTWSYKMKEHTKTLKPQPHTTGHRVVYLRSAKVKSKGPVAMADPEHNYPSPSCTSFQQAERSSNITLLPLDNKEHIQEFAQRFQETHWLI
jgi:hypothetical protein